MEKKKTSLTSFQKGLNQCRLPTEIHEQAHFPASSPATRNFLLIQKVKIYHCILQFHFFIFLPLRFVPSPTGFPSKWCPGIGFISRADREIGLLISWLQSPSAVILESPKIVCHSFHCFPIYLP